MLMHDRIECACRYGTRPDHHRRIYYRKGLDHTYPRKFAWVPVGYLCIPSGTICLDAPRPPAHQEDKP
ncbi:hypothetical protein LCGC14_1285750 [marine sediment metagenome]|uniref:Uncharacterized protein n=1 Tax=marine sediment metagenome TaxID=412755 RepID=A0A0F9NAK7_9ZZZZ